jgi:hypothetical protein
MLHYLTKLIIKKEPKLVDSAFAVVCTGHGNPSYLQDPDQYVSPEMLYACNSLTEASQICRNYLDHFRLGAGNWSGGQVYHPTMGLIANVSFNGRVWDLESKPYPDDMLNCNWQEFNTEKVAA